MEALMRPDDSNPGNQHLVIKSLTQSNDNLFNNNEQKILSTDKIAKVRFQIDLKKKKKNMTVQNFS